MVLFRYYVFNFMNWLHFKFFSLLNSSLFLGYRCNFFSLLSLSRDFNYLIFSLNYLHFLFVNSICSSFSDSSVFPSFLLLIFFLECVFINNSQHWLIRQFTRIYSIIHVWLLLRIWGLLTSLNIGEICHLADFFKYINNGVKIGEQSEVTKGSCLLF